MTPSDNSTYCDFCENSTEGDWRVIYKCDGCGADCCSDCSENDDDDHNTIWCAPSPESGYRGCWSRT